MSNDGSRVATAQDVEQFWREAEPELDRITLEMCGHHRGLGEQLDPLMLEAEAGALLRLREGAIS